jgi:hypothetical protein
MLIHVGLDQRSGACQLSSIAVWDCRVQMVAHLAGEVPVELPIRDEQLDAVWSRSPHPHEELATKQGRVLGHLDQKPTKRANPGFRLRLTAHRHRL